MGYRFSLGRIVNLLPQNSVLYRFCRRYVEYCNGENNSDMLRNGELRWLRMVLPECQTVFDVGANVGDWSAMALDSNPTCKVHCFEPSTATYQTLSRRFIGNKQVILNHIGLSATSGRMSLHRFGAESGVNSLYIREGLDIQQTDSEEVGLETLDAYCQRADVDQIDLLKLDVEGHELAVLQGATQMLTKGKIRRIQFEYGGTYIDARILLKDMFEMSTQYHYRMHKIFPHELRLIERYEQRLENFQYQNWVALR